MKIVSGDKDLTQLASDKTTVLVTRKGVTDMEQYTPEHIHEKYGIKPEQIIDMKGLMGIRATIFRESLALVKNRH